MKQPTFGSADAGLAQVGQVAGAQRLLCNFGREQHGVSAVEFALVAPLLIAILLWLAILREDTDERRGA